MKAAAVCHFLVTKMCFVILYLYLKMAFHPLHYKHFVVIFIFDYESLQCQCIDSVACFAWKRFSWFLVILIWCQHFTILHFKERYEIFRWDGISKKNYFFCVMMVMVSTWCHFKSTNSVFATHFFVSIDSSFLNFKRNRSVFCCWCLVEVWSWILVEILKQGLVKILRFKFSLNVWLIS